jgi:5'-phosphate synthase pdxT subunit
MKIGVLALQGAFAEHISVLNQLDVEALPIRSSQELSHLDGLIIPGGESTTISKLMLNYNITSEIKGRAVDGFPIFGTCAGMVLMASTIADPDVVPLGILDMEVQRNYFGRQRDSFHTRLSIPTLGEKPFPCIFIRAPVVKRINNGIETLANLNDGTIVAVKQKKLLATAFHPELTSDLRFHQYFLSIVNYN